MSQLFRLDQSAFPPAPVQVTVERGSGYLLLDRSAIQQVLDGWRFQPAMVDGRAVRALARVPVTFNLRE